MARAASKAKADGPVKVDPTAPAPTPADAVLRAKASRPTFRRGGLAFGDRDWTVIPSDLGDEALLALFAEPVLTLQAKGPDGWQTLPAEARAEAIEAARTADAKD
jgi:hypothetical protein